MEKTTHINESILGRWASARNTLLLAIWLNGTEALCADVLLIRHCAELRSELGNQITSQSPVVVHSGGGGSWCW